MLFAVAEVPVLRAPGKGVLGIKLRSDDAIMAFELARRSLAGPTVLTSFGRELVIRERKFGVSKRGGRGRVVLQRGSIDTWLREPCLQTGAEETPDLLYTEDDEGMD